MLRGNVGGTLGVRRIAQGGAHVDDLPVPLLRHDLRRLVAQVVHGLQVHPDHPVPALVRKLQEILEAVGPRVVHQDVDLPIGLQAFAGDGLQVSHIHQISLIELHPPAGFFDEAADIRRIPGTIGDEQVRSRPGQGQGVAHPQAFVGPCDDGRFPLQAEQLHGKAADLLNAGHMPLLSQRADKVLPPR